MHKLLLAVIVFSANSVWGAQAVAHPDDHLCDLSPSWILQKNDARSHAVHLLVEKIVDEKQFIVCLGMNAEIPIARSFRVSSPPDVLNVLSIQFNADFYARTSLATLYAIIAHEVAHHKDVLEVGCDQFFDAEQYIRYARCESRVDFAATKYVGDCNMLRALEDIRAYRRAILRKESAGIKERIAWLKGRARCT